MFGPRIFRSRWSALLWAAGIIWFANDVAETAPHGRPAKAAAQVDATGTAISADDLAAIGNSAVN